MIKYNKENQTFYLSTKNTTYIMQVNEYSHLEHIYYGSKIEEVKNINDIKLKYEFELGSSTSYSEESKEYMLNQKLLEVSTFGKGDYREPTIHLELPNGSRTIDLKYTTHEEVKKLHFKGVPQTTKDTTLKITLLDDINNIEVNLYYTVNFDSDVIVRNMDITNKNKDKIVLDKILSMNIDLIKKLM